jgi:hypothetical protein
MEEDNEEKLTQLLDIFVIRLEGGDQADIEAFLNHTAAGDAGGETQMKSPRTASIFFKALPASVTRAELTALCSRYPDLLRVAIAEPAGPGADRRWARRGWATFRRGAKVREICFSLNGTRLRGWELAPVLNKDLTKRIRPAAAGCVCNNGAVVSLYDRRVVRSDLRLAAKLVTGLDSRRGLWQAESGAAGSAAGGAVVREDAVAGSAVEAAPVEAVNAKSGSGVEVEAAPFAAGVEHLSGNPLLKGIQDFLVEEVSNAQLIKKIAENPPKVVFFLLEKQVLSCCVASILYVYSIHTQHVQLQ